MWWFLTNHTINPHTTSERTQTTQTSGSKPKRHEIGRWLHMNQISDPENPTGHEWHLLNDMNCPCVCHKCWRLSVDLLDENMRDEIWWRQRTGRGFLCGRADSGLSGVPWKSSWGVRYLLPYERHIYTLSPWRVGHTISNSIVDVSLIQYASKP